MTVILYIAFFGAVGCLARYFLSGGVYTLLGTAMPYGTLAVNVIGAFLIGLVMEFSLRTTQVSPDLRVGLTYGFLGGSPRSHPSATRPSACWRAHSCRRRWRTFS